ncbi:MAG: FeoB-associated Cys-rich membrane protein [Clostridia bacterium]|nr:FeoB-associated Cys-rich membrane protein [Clostridia bacterium]
MTPTAVVLIILAVWLVAAVIWIYRQKKKGKSVSCGGDCSKCSAECNSKKSR